MNIFNRILPVLSVLLALALPITALAYSWDDEDNRSATEVFSESVNAEEQNYCAPVEHSYIHYNTSTDTSSRTYRAVVFATGIALGTADSGGNPSSNDFLENIDTSTMYCSNGNSTYVDCGFNKDTVSEGDVLYSGSARNGTVITYERLDWVPGTPYGLVWRYNQDDPSSVTSYPWLDAGESKGEAIAFEPEGYTVEGQSATTEAWTKVKYYWINTSTYDSGSYSLSDFNPIYTNDVIAAGSSSVDPDGDYIYWSGVNGVERTTWPACEAAIPTCESLEITPDADSISVDHLGQTSIDFTATVTDTNGDDITSDSDINWMAFEYRDTQPSYTQTPDANGEFRYGPRKLLGRTNDLTVSADKEVSYYNAESGDWILAKVEDTTSGICEAALQLPYCTDLDITDPIALLPRSGEFSEDITIDVDSSTGEDWPYTIEWDSTATSTFDGNVPPYQTDLASGGWTVEYVSSESGVISVYALDDPAGLCSDTLTTIVTEEALCEDLTISGPYFEDGTPFDATSADDVARLDGTETMCWDFLLNVTASPTYTANLVAMAYSSNGGALTTDSLSIQVNETGSISTGAGQSLTNLDMGLPQYTGSICWAGFQEGEYLYTAVLGEADYCSADYEFDYTPDVPEDDSDDSSGDDSSGDDSSGDDSSGDDSSDDDEYCYDMEIEPVTEGETICLDIDSDYDEHEVEINYEGCDDACIIYYDEDGDVIEEVCGDEAQLVIESEEDLICGIAFQNVCSEGEISIEVLDEDTLEDNACYIDVELPEAGELDKFIYTFNFSPEQDSDEFYNTFFTHNADRAFYTLDYEPNGSEHELFFTDDLWNDGTLESDLGGQLLMVTDRSQLTSDHEDATDQTGRYSRYELIQRMGFRDVNFDEGADAIGDQIQNGSYFSPVVPYIVFDDGKDAVLIEDCVYSTNAETGEEEIQSEGICSYDLAATLEEESYVHLMNVDQFVEDHGEDIESGDVHIRLRYVAVVDNALDCANETDPCLTEKFLNSAQVDVDGLGIIEEAEALLASLCQYLVTRNAGDVFLEEMLDGGSDIACIYEGTEFDTADYRNVDSLVVYDDGTDEATEEATVNYSYDESTGVGVTYNSGFDGFSVSYCDDYEASSGGVIENLSSYVCEIVVSVADLWKASTVESTTSSQVSQAVRNADTNQASLSGTVGSWDTLVSALSNTKNTDSGVLYYQGSGADDVLTLESLTVPAGAWTLIVSDADVRITGNITYTSSASDTDYRNLPAFAIIVEGGNIDIAAGVGEINAFMVTDQKFIGDARSEVDQQLVIHGSLYGNVQELFDSARYVGAPSTNTPGGGLVIYYDETIILNTPPYLSEKVDIYTEEAVN